MKRTIAVALALSLSTSIARAGDRTEPTELNIKAPVRQALGTTDGTLFLLEGDIPQYANGNNGKDNQDDGAHRIVVWDLAKNDEASVVKDVPNGAVHMALLGTKLVVACGSNGLAVIDPKTKAVKKVSTGGWKPFYVCTDGASGKALVFAIGSATGTMHEGSGRADRMLIEVDLDSEKSTLLVDRPFGAQATVAKNTILVHDAGSSSLWFHNLPECRKPSQNKYAGVSMAPPTPPSSLGQRGWSQTWGTIRVVNGGTGIAASSLDENQVLCLSGSLSKVLWTAQGELLAPYPTKPILVAWKGEDQKNKARAARGTGKADWTLVGLHSANGKQIFSTTLAFDGKVSFGNRGDQVASAQTIVSTPDGDKFVFATREDQTAARGRGRNGADAGKVTWFMADLPKVDLSSVPVLEGEPPATVRVTEVYSFSPRVTNGEKAKFSLKKGPDGAVVDATCGRFTWRPTDKQIGKNDVEISATVGGDEFTVLSFEVLVTSADEFAAVECDFGDLTATQVVASEDGASLFLLEAKVQGQPAPASRVIVWDVQKKQIEKSINVPKSPEHMALVQGKLVVTCPDSQVVALIDTKEKKVTKSVPIQLDSKSLTPRTIFKDGPQGKVLVSCGAEQGGFEAQTVEIGLADGKVSPLYFGFGRGVNYVAVAKDYAVWSDGSWGSVSKLSDIRHAPKKGDNNRGIPQIDPDERSYQIVGARAVNNGANFVAADAGRNKTGLLSADWKKVLWTADGILAGVHPTKPIVIVYVNDPNQHFESDTLTFRGINSQSGRQVWQLIVKMPHRIRVDAWTFIRSGGIEVRSSKDGGEDLYLSAANDAFDRTGGHWYRVPMPRKDAGSTVTVTNEPPTEVDAGSTYSWAPTITGGSPTFTLKAAPDGMTVDARTGKITWKPDEASIGKHDVLLIAKVGSDEIPIAFELRVKPGHGGGDSTPKSDDSKSSKSDKSDKSKTDKPDKSDKSDKSDKPEKSDKPKPTDDGDNEH